jgi:SAM-dependent methyltransferase
VLLTALAATQDQPYLFDNAPALAVRRFDALSRLFDSVTERHLDALGITAGWRCGEVGAGGLTIADWMARRVGERGYVLATDIDISWRRANADGVDVFAHDVTADDVPAGRFDLVHARLVLSHVPNRYEALRRMVSAVRPGGWLLVEDFDASRRPSACLDPTSVEDERANRVRAAFLAMLTARGFFPPLHPAAADLERTNIARVAPSLVAGRYATPADIALHLRALAAHQVDVAMPPLVSAWGRRPC